MRLALGWWAVVAGLAACSGGGSTAGRSVVGTATIGQTATPEEIQFLWDEAMAAYRRGEFSTTAENLERLVLEFPPGDSRISKAHFYLGESYLGMNDQLQAVRQFRRVSDERPNDPLAPTALLRAGDAYAELWSRPELDPSYGQTALATYQELLNRYPETEAADRGRARIMALEEWFAAKEFKTAMYYLRLKALDSAILYLKAMVADYPRAEVAPQALEK
ncbi:MAG: outer membrane protein assembly factor BamD, partial [Gemmatimonadales bacterium]